MLSVRNISTLSTSLLARSLPKKTQISSFSSLSSSSSSFKKPINHSMLWRAPLYAPVLVPWSLMTRRAYSTPPASDVSPPLSPIDPIPSNTPITTASVPSNIERLQKTRTARIVEKIKEELHRLVDGSKQLGRNTKTAAYLLHEVSKGKVLTRRERMMLIRTVSDLMRMVPFAIIIAIPFAEFCLPVLLKLFPNMLPSTFVSVSQKEASQNRVLQAKLEVIKVLQAASEDMATRGKLDATGIRESLVSFMSKVSRGDEVTHEEVLTIAKTFESEFSFNALDKPQLQSLARFFGLPSIGTSFILQEELKYKWKQVRNDDDHILREGIDNLTPSELEEAAFSRGYSVANTHENKEKYLQEWISLSKENVPPYLLLLSRAHFFVNKTKEVTDIRPPIIAPFLPPTPQSSISVQGMPIPEQPNVIDLPEKEIVTIDFKNHHHVFTHDPVAAKLWAQIARFTRDLKKDTFRGKQMDVILLGDSTGDKLSTVITREMRQ